MTWKCYSNSNKSDQNGTYCAINTIHTQKVKKQKTSTQQRLSSVDDDRRYVDVFSSLMMCSNSWCRINHEHCARVCLSAHAPLNSHWRVSSHMTVTEEMIEDTVEVRLMSKKTAKLVNKSYSSTTWKIEVMELSIGTICSVLQHCVFLQR